MVRDRAGSADGRAQANAPEVCGQVHRQEPQRANWLRRYDPGAAQHPWPMGQRVHGAAQRQRLLQRSCRRRCRSPRLRIVFVCLFASPPLRLRRRSAPMRLKWYPSATSCRLARKGRTARVVVLAERSAHMGLASPRQHPAARRRVRGREGGSGIDRNGQGTDRRAARAREPPAPERQLMRLGSARRCARFSR